MLRQLVKGFKNSFTFLNCNLKREILVLIYHRVVDLDIDSQLLAVEPKIFESQLAYIAQNYQVLSYEELIGSIVKKLTEKVDLHYL